MIYSNGYKDHKLSKPKHPKPKKILLECGQGTGSRIFTSPSDSPFQIAYVTLDTTCLNRPEVLIKFSSIVNMERVGVRGTVRLKYELFRVCDDKEPEPVGVWMFEEVNVLNNGFERQGESFSFVFCECTNCSICCEYFVTVTPIEVTDAIATVSNGRMAALSQSLYNPLEGEDKNFDPKTDDVKFKLKHPKPKEILLSCGQGNGSVTFRPQFAEPEISPPADIAHVTIDTTCINRPNVLIEFSSIIKIDRVVTDVRLQFELFRVCGDGDPISLGIWMFERTDVFTLHLVKAFDFTFCECGVPPGCCEYFVTVKPVELAPFIDDDIIVDNVRIVAIAQSSRDILYYDDDETFYEKDDCTYCVPKSPLPKEILLECGEGTGSRSFTSSNDTAFQIAYVSIDTTCLCKPMVNIEFSSIVSFERTTGVADGRLRYELFRVCNNRRPISLGIWISERIGFSRFDKTTNIFNFTLCDCIACSGCCDYFVRVTPIRIDDAIVTVGNGRIAALAQEK